MQARERNTGSTRSQTKGVSLKLVLLGIIALSDLCAHASAKATQIIGVQAWVLSEDNGTRQAKITPGELALWLNTANTTLRDSGASFQISFNAQRDWHRLRSSTLNGLHNYRPECLPLFEKGRQLAAKAPHQLTVLFRHGRDEEATGNGFAVRPTPTQPGFIVMPGFRSTTVQRGPQESRVYNKKLFIHELGHFLGLEHTFPGSGSKQAESLTALRKVVKQTQHFDGDGIADTPEDPYSHLYFRYLKQHQCQSSQLHRIPGLDILRHNPMSYLNCTPYRFTRGQVEKMQTELSRPAYAYLSSP